MKGLKTAVPPHNEEAEVAVLGCMLIDSEAIPVVLKFLTAEDFYRPVNVDIFRAIHQLYVDKEPVDLIRLSEKLRAHKAYLVRLTSAVPTSANPAFYARSVQVASKRRKWIKASMEIYQKCFDESISVDEIADMFRCGWGYGDGIPNEDV